jgi:hypothetical protein
VHKTIGTVQQHRADAWSMIPKKPAPHLIRGGYRFSEKIMLPQYVRDAG